MAGNNRQNVEQEIKDLASIAEVAFKNIADNIKDVFEDVLSSGENVISSLTKDMAKNINSLAKDSNKLIINQSRINQGLFTSKDISKQILANEDKLYKLEQQRASTVQAINDDLILSETEKQALIEDINKEYEQSVDYNKILADKLKEQAEQLKLIEKRTGITAKILTGLKKIPILGDVLNIDKGLENMRKKALETNSTFKILGSGIKGAFEGIEKASIILAVVAAAKKIFDFIKDAMFAADERVTKLAKGLAFSKDEARGVYNSLKDTKHEIDSIYNTTKDVTEAYTDLIELTDFVTSATNNMVEAQILLTKNLGLSKEEAFGIQEAFVAFNLEADKGMDVVKNQVVGFTAQNKLLVNSKKVFADIAKTSKLIQINFKDNLGSLVKTTLEAKKLGLSLDQVRKIGDSLLDFEQSISSELEAELLTGKDINLEKARLYALNHDIAGLTQEITKQGITQEYFANLNVVQQDAIAKAYGMQSDEMADMLYKAKVLEKVGGKTLKDLRERARVSGDINLKNKVAALEQGILDGKSYDEALKATTAQEKFNQSLEQAKEMFSDFVDGGYLDDLADAIKRFTNLVSNSSEEDREYRKKARVLAENAKSEEEKKRYTNLSSQIYTPGVMDFLSLTQLPETLSKIFESKSAKSQLDNTVIPADDFTIKTNPKDTIVAMGGTKLGRTDEMVQLLTEQNRLLTGILNKEGTITLNGTKMGTAMAVGGYKVQ
jgi:hypothetical protein